VNRGPYAFVRGATLLAAASLFSRLLGGLARIPLTRLLGGEGMGLFQMSYVLYGLAITFSVSGLTVATSRLTAEALAHERPREAWGVLGRALLLGLLTGLAFWVILDQGAVFLAGKVLGDGRAAAALRAVAPAVVPVSLISALKGYFQGHQDMAPTSSSQVVEQVVRVAAMFLVVWAMRGGEVGAVVGGAAYGNLVGAGGALVFLVLMLDRRRGREARSRGGRRLDRVPPGRSRLVLPPRPLATTGRILGLALPVTMGAVVMPLMDAMQTFLIPGRLQAGGFDPRQATYLYGQLHGMAYPLAGLPAIAASAMAAALVPAIADALERGATKQVQSRVSTALRLTVLLSLPATIGLVVLAAPLNQMLFGIPEAGIPLLYVSAACLLIAVQQTTAGILQGLGLVSVPVYGLAAGLAANTAVTYYLTALPALGISGAALGIVAGFGVAAAVNLVVVVRRTGLRLDATGLLFRPAAATGVMALVAIPVHGWLTAAGLGCAVATCSTVAIAALAYVAALVAVGGIRAAEVEFLPAVGQRLAAFLTRWGRR
jgi:stage V sporulation protein B